MDNSDFESSESFENTCDDEEFCVFNDEFGMMVPPCIFCERYLRYGYLPLEYTEDIECEDECRMPMPPHGGPGPGMPPHGGPGPGMPPHGGPGPGMPPHGGPGPGMPPHGGPGPGMPPHGGPGPGMPPHGGPGPGMPPHGGPGPEMPPHGGPGPGMPPHGGPGPGMPPHGGPGPGKPPQGGPGPGHGKPPMGPPPKMHGGYFEPSIHGPNIKMVSPGSIRPCLYRFVFIWPRRGRGFWAWLNYIDRNSVSGYRWDGYRWVIFGMDLRQIDSFICY